MALTVLDCIEHIRHRLGATLAALSIALARQPTTIEIAEGVQLIRNWQQVDGATADEALRYFCLLVLNLNEFIYLD